jgi:PrgI family protein
MPRVYELPTHLQVEDQLIAGLTARQLVRLMIGASVAYGVWDQAPWLSQEVRLALAAVLAATGVVFALLQPRGRALDSWLLTAVLFVVLPRQLVWRPGTAQQHKPRPDQAGWAELELHPEWVEPEPDCQLVVSESPPCRSRLSRAGQRRLMHGRPW